MSRIAGRASRRGEQARGPRALAAAVLAVIASLTWFNLPVSALTTGVGATDRPAASWDLPWLSVHDRRIVDEAGRTVLLRGFNSSALLEPTVLRSPLDAEDASLMERGGFDVVRLAVSWGRMEPQRGRWDRAYLDAVAGTVRLLTSHHLYVVIDMHFLDWSSAFGGSGAPAWAALPLLPTLHVAALGDWQRHLSPAVVGATTYFWLSPDWQRDFMEAWQHLADRFRDNSGVAGYDLYNEPHAIPLPPARFERNVLWPLYARTIDAIGSVDPNHLFIVEGQLMADVGTVIVPLRAPNLVYSPHEYTGSLVPPTFDGDGGPVAAHVAQVAAEATRVPAALWIGEWGMAASQAGAPGWVDAVVTAFDSAGAGWAWWQWREDSPWGVRDSAGRIDTTLLTHLARPYLAATPPGVHASASDGVHDGLRLTVDGAYRAGVIEIAWPLLIRAAPVVTGTCALLPRWDPGRARLLMALAGSVPCTIRVDAGR